VKDLAWMWLMDIRLEPDDGSYSIEGGDCCGDRGAGVRFRCGIQRRNELHDGSPDKKLETSPMQRCQPGALGVAKRRNTSTYRTRTGKCARIAARGFTTRK